MVLISGLEVPPSSQSKHKLRRRQIAVVFSTGYGITLFPTYEALLRGRLPILQIAMMIPRTSRSGRQMGKGGTPAKSKRQPQSTNYGGQPSGYDSRRSTFAEVSEETNCLNHIIEASKSESAQNTKPVSIPTYMSLQAANKSHKNY